MRRNEEDVTSLMKHVEEVRGGLYTCSAALGPLLSHLAQAGVGYEDVLSSYEALLRARTCKPGSDIVDGAEEQGAVVEVYTPQELQQAMRRVVRLLAGDAMMDLAVQVDARLDAGVVLRCLNAQCVQLEVPEDATEVRRVLADVLFQEFLRGDLAAFQVAHIAGVLSRNELSVHRTSAVEYLFNQSCVQTLPYTMQRISDDLRRLLAHPMDEWAAAELRFALCTSTGLLHALIGSAVADANVDAATALEFAFCPVVVTDTEVSVCAEVKRLFMHTDLDNMLAGITEMLQMIQGGATHEHEPQDQQLVDELCFLAFRLVLANLLKQDARSRPRHDATSPVLLLQSLPSLVSVSCYRHCAAALLEATTGDAHRALRNELRTGLLQTAMPEGNDAMSQLHQQLVGKLH